MKLQNKTIRSNKERVTKELERIETEKSTNPQIDTESMNRIFCNLISIDKKITQCTLILPENSLS